MTGERLETALDAAERIMATVRAHRNFRGVGGRRTREADVACQPSDTRVGPGGGAKAWHCDVQQRVLDRNPGALRRGFRVALLALLGERLSDEDLGGHVEHVAEAEGKSSKHWPYVLPDAFLVRPARDDRFLFDVLAWEVNITTPMTPKLERYERLWWELDGIFEINLRVFDVDGQGREHEIPLGIRARVEKSRRTT